MSDRKATNLTNGPTRMRSKRRRKIVQILIGFYGNRCYYCTRSFQEDPEFRSLDHLIPLSRGGSHELSNLVLCCIKCNNAKADMTWWEYVQTADYRKRRDWIVRLRHHPPKCKPKVEIIDTLVV